MHSRVFQVSQRAEVPKEHYIGEDIFEDLYQTSGGIVDYCDYDERSKEDDIKWLASFLENNSFDVEVNGDSISFKGKEVISYLRNKLDLLRESVDKLELSLAHDPMKFTLEAYRTTSILDDRFGFYIADYDSENDLYTIDEFVRYLLHNLDREKTYTIYIGATVDFHT